MDKIMNMDVDSGSTYRYIELLEHLSHDDNVPLSVTNKLWNFTALIFRAELESNYTKPTSWIGLYIAAASLLCVFAMVADLFHGLQNRKLWFPCKYVTINAAFISVMSTALKLPMDITSSMPGNVDQVTKLGSMAFLCTVMANGLPSLATMNIKELRTNIIGLGVMVTTLVVNVGIQIQTGVVSYDEYDHFLQTILLPIYFTKPKDISNKRRNIEIAAVYMTLLLMLLIIYICSCLVILKTKKKIEAKYKELHEEAVLEAPQSELTVEKVSQHVSKWWILAGNPQFITVCFVTTSACGVICVISTALHIRTLFWTIDSLKAGDYKSDYQWSMLVIFVIQFIGVILGTIAPFSRCFVDLCFKLSNESLKYYIMVFKVESYWYEKLNDWKPISIISPFRRNHKFMVIITEHMKIVFLKFCVAFQKTVVVTCKIISLVPLLMICAFYFLKCLYDICKAIIVSSKRKKEPHVEPGNNNNEENIEALRPYMLQLPKDVKISGTTLKWLSKSSKRLIEKFERRQPKYLLELIMKSFEGIENFDHNHVAALLPKECQDWWSLPVINLTIIAVSLPDIDKSEAMKLLESVGEGLVYVTHVEQSLNTTDNYVNIQKATETLWLEFEVKKTWLTLNMQEIASQKNTAKEIIQLFKENSEDMVKKVEELDNGSRDDNSECKSKCANSMRSITEEILCCPNVDLFSQQQLFDHISEMISGILAACLKNLPKVIVMKCHTSEIEKSEATVQEAAKLLGETKQIIDALQDTKKGDPQGLNPNDDLP